MNNKLKVIKALEKCSSRDCPTCPYYSPNDSRCIRELIYDALTLLKKQEEQLSIKTENFNRLVAKVEVMPKIVRCKDCIHRWKSEKCVLAAISEEKDYPLFMLDNRGEWFCADGERR